MSTEYNKTAWQDGDVITADKMNNIENGIYACNEDIANLETNKLDDVQVNGTSIVTDGVANVPVANGNTLGVVKTKNADNFGIRIASDGNVEIYPPSDGNYKAGTAQYKPVCILNQHQSTFYGLAKAAGADEKDSTLPVGQYTDEAKAAIQTMLGVPSVGDTVSDVTVDGYSVVHDGVAQIAVSNGLRVGNNNARAIMINEANQGMIRNKTNTAVITPSVQHISVFYGLAEAAGDTTQTGQTTIGQYTEDAKSAISEMLGGSVAVSGTTPTINAKAGIRYVCGEVLSLDITLPASGIVDVVFTSGSTRTVLTITPPTGQTVKWANGFDPASLDADTVYEINIMDGLGVAASWT